MISFIDFYTKYIAGLLALLIFIAAFYFKVSLVFIINEVTVELMCIIIVMLYVHGSLWNHLSTYKKIIKLEAKERDNERSS